MGREEGGQLHGDKEGGREAGRQEGREAAGREAGRQGVRVGMEAGRQGGRKAGEGSLDLHGRPPGEPAQGRPAVNGSSRQANSQTLCSTPRGKHLHKIDQ